MKLNSAIVGAYMPKEVMYNGELRAVYGISAYEVILYNKRDGCEHDYVAYEHCQLILLSFDKISDEDAVEVGKAFGLKNMDGHYYEWIGKAIITHYFTMYSPWDDGIFDTASNRGLVTNIHSRNYLKLIDCLRLKDYDCGHGSIPSLIAAGVAVKKETK